MNFSEAVEILGDLRVSIENHSIGLDEIEKKRSQDRIDALNLIVYMAYQSIKPIVKEVNLG